MHSQYLGKDKVLGFAKPTTDAVEVHELVDYNEIKEMMWGPRNHVPQKQAKYKLPAVPIDNAFLTSPADIPGPRKWTCRMLTSSHDKVSVWWIVREIPNNILPGQRGYCRMQLITMDIDTGDSSPVSSRPYTLALNTTNGCKVKLKPLNMQG